MPEPGPSFPPFSIFHPSFEYGAGALQERVDMLVRAYRSRGHIVSAIDPLGQPREQPAELDPASYGFTQADMAQDVFFTGARLPLSQVIQRLRNTYCRSIGVQFMHIDDVETRRWLQDRMEPAENRLSLSRDEQVRILTRLTDAVVFEE